MTSAPTAVRRVGARTPRATGPARAHVPTGHRGPPGDRRSCRPDLSRRPAVLPRRLHRGRRLLRHLRVPHHRPARRRDRADRTALPRRLLRPPRQAPAARRDGRPARHGRRCPGCSCSAAARLATSPATSSRARCYVVNWRLRRAGRRLPRPGQDPSPSCTSGRWRWRSSSTSSGRCCCIGCRAGRRVAAGGGSAALLLTGVDRRSRCRSSVAASDAGRGRPGVLLAA